MHSTIVYIARAASDELCPNDALGFRNDAPRVLVLCRPQSRPVPQQATLQGMAHLMLSFEIALTLC